MKKTFQIALVSFCFITFTSPAATTQGNVIFGTIANLHLTERQVVNFGDQIKRAEGYCEMQLKSQKYIKKNNYNTLAISAETLDGSSICQAESIMTPGIFEVSGHVNAKVSIKLMSAITSSWSFTPKGLFIPLGLNEKAINTITQQDMVVINSNVQSSTLSGSGSATLYIGGRLIIKKPSNLNNNSIYNAQYKISVIY